jgi:hypothetical protein
LCRLYLVSIIVIEKNDNVLTSNDSERNKTKGRLNGGLKLVVLITVRIVVSKAWLGLDGGQWLTSTSNIPKNW